MVQVTANISEVPPVPKTVRCPCGHKENSGALMTLGSTQSQCGQRGKGVDRQCKDTAGTLGVKRWGHGETWAGGGISAETSRTQSKDTVSIKKVVEGLPCPKA